MIAEKRFERREEFWVVEGCGRVSVASLLRRQDGMR